MRLPSSYIPQPYRSTVRFLVIGSIGTFVQSGFFLLAMACFRQPEKETTLYYVAFAIGFVCEMIPNYILTNWYTFGTRPNIKNAGGFILARGVNLVLQFLCLPLALHLLPDWNNAVLSFVVIFVAGIANYLIQLMVFRKKPTH